MKKVTAILFLTFFALNGVAWAQRVKDFVLVEGARSNKLQGVGLVVGLPGTGDDPKGITAAILKNYLQNHAGWEVTPEQLSSKSVALVSISAELPPFQAKGTTIDIRVSAMRGAKSLIGGELLPTPLRGPRARALDPTVYALAGGRLIGEGDVQKGVPTAASIPNGAMIEAELESDFVRADGEGGSFFLFHLNKTDFIMANAIAEAVNNSGKMNLEPGEATLPDIALAIDGGTVRVKIPTKEQMGGRNDFVSNPVSFLSRVLDANVQIVSEDRSVVAINDVTKVIAVTGDVLVKKGRAERGGDDFTIPNDMPLVDVLEKLGEKLTAQDKIDLIRALDQAGLIKGTLISR